MSYLDDAKNFELKETAFHLGFLPTEQSHPATAAMDIDFKNSTVTGVRTLQRVDRDVQKMAEKMFTTPEFAKLCEAIYSTITTGYTVVFSGCGATGR